MSAPAELRALIVEDEPLAAELLASMLARHTDVAQIAIASDGATALARCGEVAANVAFVDIELGVANGFTLLRQLGDRIPHAVAIVTAHGIHAVEAFEIAAVDFLLKPFDEQRLALTLERMRRRLAGAAGEQSVAAPAASSFLRRFAAWQPGEQRARLVAVERVPWIEAAGRSVRCHTAGQAFTVRLSITDVAGMLDPAQFARINRSTIVNIAQVVEIQRWFRGNYMVVLSSGQRFRTTTSCRAAVERILAGL